MSLLYDTTTTYNSDYTYYGVGNGVVPVLKVEMDLSSTFPTEVLDIDYGGVLAYDTSSEYDPADRYDGFVVFDDITSSVRSVSINRGKSSLTYDHFDAGTCAIELADFNSTFLPDEPNSRFYPNITPLRQVRISAEWSGETFVLFRGFVDDWDIRWQPKQQYTEVAVTSTDATKLIANFDTTVTGADDDTVAQRIQLMLTAQSWPADFTNLDTSGAFAYLIEDTSDQRPMLPNIQEYETAEQGAFFVSKEGRVTFKPQYLAYPGATGVDPEYEFSDTGAVGKVSTTGIDYSVSDKAFYNTVTVIPTIGAEAARASNSSIDEYRERGLILTDVPLADNGLSLPDELAKFIIARQARPQARITGVSTDPRLNTHSARMSVRGELLEPITITRTPPGGTTSTYKMFIIGIAYEITPETWRTQITTDYRIDIITTF